MELCIRLDLPNPQGKLTLEPQATEAKGDVRPVQVSLPFDEKRISIIVRALDLNASPYLKRQFSPEEARVLRELDLIADTPPEDVPLTLTGEQLHREKLQEIVRREMYKTLFEPLNDVLSAHLTFLRGRGEDRVLHVHLEMWSDQLVLFQLPWELLHDDHSLDGAIHISRYIRYQSPVDALEKSSHLRLLVLHSEPTGLQPLDLHDQEKIGKGLRGARFESAFEIEYFDAATPGMLGDALTRHSRQPTVVHFAGHGEFGWRCEHCGVLTIHTGCAQCENCRHPFPSGAVPCGYLAFTREHTGLPHWVRGDEMGDMLRLGNVQLVVLNACKSALGRRGEDVFNGIAQRLMDTVPAVLATPFPLDNLGAEEFARCFYQGLGNGLSLVETLHQVRLRMRTPYPDEWYRPVLYLRDKQKDGGCVLDTAVSHGGSESGAETQETVNYPVSELAVYFVDFTRQEQEFNHRVREHRGRDDQGLENPVRNRPLVFLIPGWVNDITGGYLLERLIYELKDKLRHYDDNYKAIEATRIGAPKRLSCTGAESPERLESVLLESVRDSLFGTHPLPRDRQRAMDYIRNYTFTEPVIFYAHLKLAELNRGDVTSFMQRFHEFWGGWCDQNHLLSIFVFISYIKTPCTIWEWAADLFQGHKRINQMFDKFLNTLQPHVTPGVEGAVLPRLEPVDRTEVDDWAWKMKSLGVLRHPRFHRELHECIEELFNGRKVRLIEGRLPLSDLCSRLDDFLMKIESGKAP